MIPDSGERVAFGGGMVRDTDEGKPNPLLVRIGPMYRRWVWRLTHGDRKYDEGREPGNPRNWELACDIAAMERFKESAVRHFDQWIDGEEDEDHAAAVFFNVNGFEYVKERLAQVETPSAGETFTRSVLEEASWDSPAAVEARMRVARG